MAKVKSNKLSVKDLPDSTGGGVPKTLQPGNVLIKINSIELRKEPFEGNPYNLILNCEGPDMGPEFEGFQINKDRPELGKAKGQVGRVRATEYAFSDRTVGDKQISRDRDILKWVQSFCKALGISDWFLAQDEKHDTIQDFVNQLNMDKPFEDIWVNSCLAGKSYTNAQGFLNYDLFLPWFSAKAVPLELENAEPSKIIKFSEEMHIKSGKKKPAVVDEFSGGRSRSGGSDFDL